jgi:hypothetical protein
MDVKIKYMPGDKVWRMVDNRPAILEIYEVEILKSRTFDKELGGKFTVQYLASDYVRYKNDHLFDSKAELIASL